MLICNKNVSCSHLEIDVGLHVCLKHREAYEGVLGSEGNRMMDRVIPLSEFTGDSDNGCDALMRSLMASNATCNLQIWIPVEPDLLQLTYEVW